MVTVTYNEAAISTLHHNEVDAVPEVFRLFGAEARLERCRFG